jgi:hypothetical protein
VNKKIILSLFLVLGLVGMAMAEGTKPIQLSLFNPIQMVPEAESIGGVSLGLLYTVNQNVTGFSLTLGVNRAKGDVKGVAWGLGNWVDGLFYGWQDGLVSRVGGRFVGLQEGWVAITQGDLTGAQCGLVTWTDGYVHGAQLGIFNYTVGRFIGAQLGAVNVVKGDFSGASLGIVNYVEGTAKGLQLGLVNHAKSLNGLQIGLANYNGNKKPMEFMVLANWSF